MDIYNLNLKGMRNLLIKFSNTLYGKTIFIICYTMPFLIFIYTILGYILSFLNRQNLIICLALTLATFLIGNAYYYHEVKDFCKYLKEKNEANEHLTKEK